MKKYLILLIIVCSTLMGCNQKAEEGRYDEKELTGKPALHKFDFNNHGFPPYPPGFIKVDETRSKMEMGGFRWEKGNTTTLTDAASPQQIAENFKAIVLEPNSKVNIQIEQDPALSAYLWDSEREKVTIEGTQITIPTNKGRYIYEVVAKWSNGEVSYTIVVEVE
ncbi:hypothetical protein [Sporosarcina limicola]|uniref:Lipoprotein NlpE involved in copper resistance n=1 Tax=Sporosarcina limicola TaxID=34101 RepID=A0A927MNS0_9BACL|nr:hypothetical protein [Sporosarcina limicola]MBE1556257.1 putative lipoprotein NlpE involved in copper resistance [Sporosarcina limicola]